MGEITFDWIATAVVDALNCRGRQLGLEDVDRAEWESDLNAWLAAHDAEKLAEGWDEGREFGHKDCQEYWLSGGGGCGPDSWDCDCPNPHRTPKPEPEGVFDAMGMPPVSPIPGVISGE